MAMKPDSEQARREAENSPVAWFVVLERAREQGDFERAAKAQRELRRLGVIVRLSHAGQGGG